MACEVNKQRNQKYPTLKFISEFSVRCGECVFQPMGHSTLRLLKGYVMFVLIVFL
jgi:hypothetical protein